MFLWICYSLKKKLKFILSRMTVGNSFPETLSDDWWSCWKPWFSTFCFSLGGHALGPSWKVHHYFALRKVARLDPLKQVLGLAPQYCADCTNLTVVCFNKLIFWLSLNSPINLSQIWHWHERHLIYIIALTFSVSCLVLFHGTPQQRNY